MPKGIVEENNESEGAEEIEAGNSVEEDEDNLVGDPNMRGLNPLSQKIAGALIARAYLPSPDDIKQAMVYGDLGMKI